jgi:hypothetical protein
MPGMSKDETLAMIDRDLARGHTYLAGQRLASLCSIYPDDLEVRSRRAAVNHQVGNFPEAGRWGYLTEEVTPDEIAAFENVFKSPWEQLRALKLRGDPSSRLGPVARQRLDTLLRRAEEEGRAPIAWTEPVPGPTLGSDLAFGGCMTVIVLGVITLFGFAVYGIVMLFGSR